MNALTLQSFKTKPSGPQARLGCGLPLLDGFLGGGLPWGKWVEWGAPTGQEGWSLILPFVAQASRKGLCLWVGAEDRRQPFAPSWIQAGVKPERMLFLGCAKPLKEAKEVFPHPLVRLILLDGPKGLRNEDLAYLATQARLTGKLILLVRPHFLSEKRGNVWAALRFNGWRRQRTGDWVLRCLKGPLAAEVRLPAEGGS